MKDHQTDACPAPCAGLTDSMGYPAFSDHVNSSEPYSYVKMYFKRNVKVRRIIHTYGAVSMLAEIGGYTGLLLGFSCFQLSGIVARLIRGLPT